MCRPCALTITFETTWGSRTIKVNTRERQGASQTNANRLRTAGNQPREEVPEDGGPEGGRKLERVEDVPEDRLMKTIIFDSNGDAVHHAGWRGGSDAFDRTVDCGVCMGAGRSDPKEVRSLQRDGHGAGDALATVPELHWPHPDANALDLVGLRELRQRSEYSILGIRPRLLADRALTDYFNVH